MPEDILGRKTLVSLHLSAYFIAKHILNIETKFDADHNKNCQ
jgi:hypothetical protein